MFNQLPSTHQEKFYDWCDHGQGHAVLNSVAGSGKSTTLLTAAQRFAVRQHSVVFVAFSNKVVEDAQNKVVGNPTNPRIDIKTVHKIGRACLAHYLGKKLRPVDQSKYEQISRGWINKNATGYHVSKRLWSRALAKITTLIRQNLIDPEQSDALDALMVRFNIELPEFLRRGVNEILNEGNRLAKQGIIDFTDMLYLPSLWQLKSPQYDVVLADEAQDFNLAQLELIAKLIAPHGRFVGAGDPHQAIMAFSGADDQAFYRVRDRFHAATFTLPVCYRCPISHIELVKAIVPEIEAWEGAQEGVLTYASEDQFLDLVQNGDLILHRKTAPLIQKCITLLIHGFVACISGKDIEDDLIDLIDQVTDDSRKE